MTGLVEIGRGFRESFFMLEQTFWAFALGLCISGLFQEFIPRTQVERRLGNHRPAAVALSAGFGIVSSSCSYAASAVARRLYSLGADLISALTFMVASTNLVVELGIVLGVLIGWQFVAGEFAGGIVMIVVMALVGSALLPTLFAQTAPDPAEIVAFDSTKDHLNNGRFQMTKRLVSAASFTISDLMMLKKELIVGMLGAGLLSEVVPNRWWSSVFVTGHGILGAIENASVGPLVAMVACVCSIGNVPLAATLWHKGVDFGGVIAFIFADLLALPLVFVYRRSYGIRLSLRIVLLLYISMVSAALVIDGVFSIGKIVPVNRNLAVFSEHLPLNATAVLDLVFAAVLLTAIGARRINTRAGTSERDAIDPICRMQVRKDTAAIHLLLDGDDYYFCSDGCADRFVAIHNAPDPNQRDRDAGAIPRS